MTKLFLSGAAMTFVLVAGASSSLASEYQGHSYYFPQSCYRDCYRGETDYYASYGTRFAYGYYYQGPNHNHWRYRQWDSRYGCYCYYDPSCTTWYYWCPPDSRFYPVNYNRYGTYSWSAGGNVARAVPNGVPQTTIPGGVPNGGGQPTIPGGVPNGGGQPMQPSAAPNVSGFAPGNSSFAGNTPGSPATQFGGGGFANPGTNFAANTPGSPATQFGGGFANPGTSFAANSSPASQFGGGGFANPGTSFAANMSQSPYSPTGRVDTGTAMAQAPTARVVPFGPAANNNPAGFAANTPTGRVNPGGATAKTNQLYDQKLPVGRIATNGTPANRTPQGFNPIAGMGVNRTPQSSRFPTTPFGRVGSNNVYFPNNAIQTSRSPLTRGTATTAQRGVRR